MVGDKEFTNMQRRVIALEEENERLRLEIKQLKECLNYMEKYIVNKFQDINPRKVKL